MFNKDIEKLMRDAIEFPRPELIKPYLYDVWNQPFFYKIDKAKVLTLSYNPTDNGAKTNYQIDVAKYKKDGVLDTDRVLDILYNFKKEEKWRRNYDLIFNHLGFTDDEIAHMDASFFPYTKLEYYQNFKWIDKSNQFLFKAIELLGDNLRYIFVDGKDNKETLNMIMDGKGKLIDRVFLPINSSRHTYELSIYKYRNLYVVYYACFLYGGTCPSTDCVNNIAEHIMQITGGKR